MENPFVFGTVAEGARFTDRKNEIEEIKSVLNSRNHLVMISPRRFGKTSLILKSTDKLRRPVIYLDLQLVTDTNDFATELLKRTLKVYKWENIRHYLSSFRIVPTVELNPVTNSVSVSFLPAIKDDFKPLAEVLDLIEKIANDKKRPIVIIDEFQEVNSLGKALSKQLRSVMQHHKLVNYVFLGSIESMMKQIFETKKSPFYHFGYLMKLDKIPHADFLSYLEKRLKTVTDQSVAIAEDILEFTDCHPYYTQQLAFYCFSWLEKNRYNGQALQKIINNIVEVHSNDYQRLWNTLSNTDKKILISLAAGKNGTSVTAPASTAYSGLQRLAARGYLLKDTAYKFDDPFFKKWITEKRG
jgi:AAA+ ATPase superfamily predicted ATPase